jgi:hypothetical protein
MRVSHLLVYDKLIAGTSPVYTAGEHNEALGRINRFALFGIASRTAGGTPGLSVYVEWSSDEVTWGSAAIWAIALSTTDLTKWSSSYSEQVGEGVGFLPKFVRLRFELTGTTPSTYLKAWVTGHSDARVYTP